MSKPAKVANEATLKQPNADRLKNWAMPKIDWIAKIVAGAFLIATSYGYVQTWLKAHQDHSDLSVAGAIMVVSIALYLYCRQR